MSGTKEDLASLTAEQTRLQLPEDLLERTIRSRGLTDYSGEFQMPRDWLKIYLANQLLSQKRVVFVDLGCGDRVALIDALRLADKLNRPNLRTIGVDVLPADPKSILPVYRQRYKPEFIKSDIDKFKFPEDADVVTLSNVLLWTRDPLYAFANAAAQNRVGGIVCAHNLNGIYENDTKRGNPAIFHDRIYLQGGKFNGFEVLNRFKAHPRAAILKKVAELNTAEEVLQSWFGQVPQLDLRASDELFRGFSYYYSFAK